MHYFAQVYLFLIYKLELATVEAVRQQLAARGDRWALALEEGKLLAAVNQTLTSFEHPVASGDEVAFFPPVTGGWHDANPYRGQPGAL